MCVTIVSYRASAPRISCPMGARREHRDSILRVDDAALIAGHEAIHAVGGGEAHTGRRAIGGWQAGAIRRGAVGLSSLASRPVATRANVEAKLRSRAVTLLRAGLAERAGAGSVPSFAAFSSASASAATAARGSGASTRSRDARSGRAASARCRPASADTADPTGATLTRFGRRPGAGASRLLVVGTAAAARREHRPTQQHSEPPTSPHGLPWNQSIAPRLMSVRKTRGASERAWGPRAFEATSGSVDAS